MAEEPGLPLLTGSITQRERKREHYFLGSPPEPSVGVHRVVCTRRLEAEKSNLFRASHGRTAPGGRAPRLSCCASGLRVWLHAFETGPIFTSMELAEEGRRRGLTGEVVHFPPGQGCPRHFQRCFGFGLAGRESTLCPKWMSPACLLQGKWAEKMSPIANGQPRRGCVQGKPCPGTWPRVAKRAWGM